jgi:hypothetical protein
VLSAQAGREDGGEEAGAAARCRAASACVQHRQAGLGSLFWKTPSMQRGMGLGEPRALQMRMTQEATWGH